ncbi:hypothetical protein D3C79_527250 [compost metagenome]
MPGQQVAAARLGAQAIFDEGAEQAGGSLFIVRVMFERFEQLGVGPAQALRVNDDADVDRKGALFGVEIQVDRHHFADFHAQELYRRIDFQATQ